MQATTLFRFYPEYPGSRALNPGGARTDRMLDALLNLQGTTH